ncbi:MAG: CapA family protein [Anaerolineae bacterium]
MRRALPFAFVLVLAIALSACGSTAAPTATATAAATAVPPTATAPAATPTLTPAPTFTATATATPEPTATPTPAPVALWVQPAVPAVISKAIVDANDLRVVASQGESDAAVTLADDGPAEWVLVPAVPFPTIPDDIAYEDIVAFWRGSADALTYLSDGAGSPTLYVTEPVLEALKQSLGEPAAGTAISVVEADAIVDAAWEARPLAWAIVPFDELEARWKVLSLDGADVFARGFADVDYPLRLHFAVSGERAADVTAPAVTNRDEEKMTTVVMTGVTAMAREFADRMETYGVLYPTEYVRDVMQAADIAHISNEIPFAESCDANDPSVRAAAAAVVFCSDQRYIEALEVLGTDVIELTGNHFQDYGSEATLLTVEMYDEEGWPHFGGGTDLEDAQRPIIMTDHDNSVSFMGCNPVGPEYAWAAEEHPGAAPCDYEYMHGQLNELKEEVDVPIVTWQYWEHYFYEATGEQQEDFRGMIDAGADIVSGSQAHHPQCFEFYNGGFIHYGLGNFFFAQHNTPQTDLECIDRHVIYDGRHISTQVLTFRLVDDVQPQPMTPDERRELLTNLFVASGW